MELVGSTEAAAASARLLDTFRKAGWPVFHIQHISVRPNATFFLPESPGVAIHQSVEPRVGEPVITKYYPNSFRETSLLEQLKSAGVKQLLICGMMTSMCVDATVRAAFDLGFECTVVSDACATRDLSFNGESIPASHVHGAFLAALGSVYATVRTADAIIQGMQ